jgi:hypothetical protein
MRTLVSMLVGVCLVTGPALAQQHLRVPSGVYTGSLANGDARAEGRVRSDDIVDPAGWRNAKPTTDGLYDDACHSSHPVFSCPGTP